MQTLDLAWRDAWAQRIHALQTGAGEHALADLSADNLYLFRHAHGYQFVEGEWPVVVGHAYDGTPHAIPLFDVAKVPTHVLAYLLQQHGCLYPLSASQKQAWEHAHPGLPVTWTSVRDDADYVYTGKSFETYDGLHAKRNLVKQLLAVHAVEARPYSLALAEDALSILQAWLSDKRKQAGDADDLPCREALRLAPAWDWHGMLFWVDQQPAGFVLAQAIQPGVWVMRFAKASTAFKGLPQYMFQHFCRDHAAREVRWLNFEQDLGLMRFRQTKMSYRPSHLLTKYRALPPLDTPNG